MCEWSELSRVHQISGGQVISKQMGYMLELLGHAVYGMPEGICIMRKPNPWDRIAPADCINPATREVIAISRGGMQPPTCNITKSNQTAVTRHYHV
jgi:hypothetical protein